MKLATFTFIAILSQSWCYAQNDYIITTKNDTLRGHIELLLPGATHEEITIELKDNTRKFKAFQFIIFKQNGETFRTVKFGKVYKIMRVEIDGYLSLLTFRPANNYRFGAKYLLKKSGAGMEVPSFAFKNQMSAFLSNCDAVVTKLEDKTYRSKDLETIISAYNHCIKQRTQELYNVPEVVTQQTGPAGNKIKQIEGKLKSDNTESSAELKILLKDIRRKLTRGEKIPSYMISALKMQSKGFEKIKVDINDLADLLSQ